MLLSTASTPSSMSCYRRPWLCAAIEAFIEGGHPPTAQAVSRDRSPSPSHAIAEVWFEGGDGSPSNVVAAISPWQVAEWPGPPPTSGDWESPQPRESCPGRSPFVSGCPTALAPPSPARGGEGSGNDCHECGFIPERQAVCQP
jgi:hypothetical protein